MDKIVRIGAGSGGRLDSALGIEQHLGSATPPDYVIFDHMAEAMVSIFLIEMSRDPDLGYSAPFLDIHILPYLQRIAECGTKIITNAGGLNPHAAARILQAKATALGLKLKIGIVTGDDLRPQLPALAKEGHREMFSGKPWPENMIGATAYFGAFPIAAALAAGADIVLTGRVVDSALALGPLIHEFDWGREDYDRLCAGTLVGHLLECGAQATGGTFTDWLDLPDNDNIGFGIAECRADGSFVLTKPEGTGGAASIGTVSEQILYEVNDPAAYIVPDVICNFANLNLEQMAPDRVRVTGATGRAPPGSYKISAISDAGWKAAGLIPVIGIDAQKKARRMAEAVFTRTARLAESAGLPPALLTHSELLAAGELTPRTPASNADAGEAVARLVYLTKDVRAARIFGVECSAMCLNGSAGALFSPLAPSISPSHMLFCFLLPRDRLTPRVEVDGIVIPMVPEPSKIPQSPPARLLPPDTRPGGGPASVPLIALAWARSGDKGNLFNLAVIARKPEYLPHIRTALTPEAVADWMRHLFDDPEDHKVTRFDAPGLHAINFLLEETMRGSTGTNLKLDVAAKGMAQQLLNFPIPVPTELARALGDPA